MLAEDPPVLELLLELLLELVLEELSPDVDGFLSNISQPLVPGTANAIISAAASVKNFFFMTFSFPEGVAIYAFLPRRRGNVQKSVLF